jgi:hypothetical protein
MSKRPQKPRKKCIFCGGNVNSKEHIYSKWTHDLLPRVEDTSYNEDFHTFKNPKSFGTVEVKTRPGDITTKKVRAVCTSCNNGWMNRVEGLAKPILTPLIKGENIALNPESQAIVARWITMKIIVCEYTKNDQALTPLADRQALMNDGKIPSYYRIYACRQHSEWSTAFNRHSTIASKDISGPRPPLDGLARNIEQVTLVLGRMVFHVNAVHVDDLVVEDFLNPALHNGIRIWPIEREHFEWTSTRSLGAQDIANLANSMKALFKSPNVRWMEGLPPNM